MNFSTAVHALVDSEVEFIIIGGWSAVLHGSISPVTYDLDIFFSRHPKNLGRVVAALRPFHPRLRGLPTDAAFIWDEATLRNGAIFRLTTDVADFDLVAEVSGLGSFEEVKRTGVTVDAFGRSVQTLGLKSLIRAKRAAGREKDLRTLPELESLLEAEER
jgi:predicted nucleotidyltransferase